MDFVLCFGFKFEQKKKMIYERIVGYSSNKTEILKVIYATFMHIDSLIYMVM